MISVIKKKQQHFFSTILAILTTENCTKNLGERMGAGLFVCANSIQQRNIYIHILLLKQGLYNEKQLILYIYIYNFSLS